MDHETLQRIVKTIEERCHHHPSATCKVYHQYRQFYRDNLDLVRNLNPRQTGYMLKALHHYLVTGEEAAAERIVGRHTARLSQEDRAILYGMIIALHLTDFSEEALGQLKRLIAGFSPEMEDLTQRNLICGICIQWRESSPKN